MEIRWSLPAAEDLERICERIERDNSDAARRVAHTVYDACARLKARTSDNGVAKVCPDAKRET